MCVCVFPIVAKQWFGAEKFTAVANTQAIEKLLDASFSVRSVLYQNEGD
jgi:hypothetical protein